MAPQIDLAEALGATEDASVERLTLYIPSRDRDGVEFDATPWIEEALRLLSGIGGGATAMPPAEGAWLDPESGALVREKVVLAYTFLDPDRFAERLPDLRRFLHRLGRETRQGEVVCDFDGVFYKITDYDGI